MVYFDLLEGTLVKSPFAQAQKQCNLVPGKSGTCDGNPIHLWINCSSYDARAHLVSLPDAQRYSSVAPCTTQPAAGLGQRSGVRSCLSERKGSVLVFLGGNWLKCGTVTTSLWL